MKWSLLAFFLMIMLLPLSSINPVITPRAFSQSAGMQLLDKINGLDLDLRQINLRNHVSMDGMYMSGVLWQTPDQSISFSAYAPKGTDNQTAAQFAARQILVSSNDEKPVSIGNHSGKIILSSEHGLASVYICWGDNSTFFAIASFVTYMPLQIAGDKDQVKAFVEQQRKAAIDTTTKIEGILTQHGIYDNNNSSLTKTSQAQEITGTITSLNPGSIIYIKRVNGTMDIASLGLVLHEGDVMMSSSKKNSFSKEVEIDFGYGKIKFYLLSPFTIDHSVLKDNLAKTQMKLQLGPIKVNKINPIETKYNKDKTPR